MKAPFSILAIPATWCLVALCTVETSAAEATPPNIVIVLGDDHGWRDAGCYGNQEVRTPNLDHLAQQGLRFTQAFTATAMCAPTRQQLYTGLFPVRNGAYPNHSRVRDGVKSLPHYLKKIGYRVALAGKTHIGPRASFPFEYLPLEKAEAFIERDDERPYCLVFASHHPHVKWTAGDASQYDPQKLTVPPQLADTPETRSALCRYYAEVTALDEQVGSLMRCVREAGDEDNTIFLYTSEQGAQFPFGKWTCYDHGLHVELIVRWPGHVAAGRATDALVQYVDVVPTLLAAIGREPPAGLDGRSFLPVLLGESDEHADYVYGVHTTQGIIAGRPYPIRSIRDRRYKYIRNLNADEVFHNTVIASDAENYWRSWVAAAETDEHAAARVTWYQRRPAEEFYDLETDPYELHNLAADPAHRDRITAMRRRLEAWMKQQGDEGMATELQAGEHRQGRNR
ncbi:MAG: sulfatase [Pirellulaceae bacterium]